MTGKTHIKRRIVRCACLCAACLCIAGCGCTESGEPGARGPGAARQKSVVPSRIEDPEYVGKLQASIEERKKLLGERGRIAADLEAAREANASEERVAELEAKLKACDGRLTDQQKRAQGLVTARIHKEFRDLDDAAKKNEEAKKADKGEETVKK